MTEPSTTKQVCSLCLRLAKLQVSHVIPTFMVRKQRSQSITGRFISGEDRLSYLQDGPKRQMLCYDCEQKLGRSEAVSARKVWNPLCRNTDDRVPYGEEFYKMCVAISWRAVEYSRLERCAGSEWQGPREVWRAYLNNERSDCDGLNQHLLIFPEYDIGSSLPTNLPPRLNQYLKQGLSIRLMTFPNIPTAMTKIGNLVLFGIGAVDRSESPWADHLVHPHGGAIGIDNTINVPTGIWASLVDAANKYADFADGRTQDERATEVKSRIQ